MSELQHVPRREPWFWSIFSRSPDKPKFKIGVDFGGSMVVAVARNDSGREVARMEAPNPGSGVAARTAILCGQRVRVA